ncbi:hypothetical protein FBZ91_11230 [Nitrospirillum viridazoti]|nr:hypothetical protein FBZ91_11230 [Nitrospirillum amazonense]
MGGASNTCVGCDNATVSDSLTFEQYLDMAHVVVIIGDKRTPAFEQWFLDRYGYARKVGAVAPDFSSAASPSWWRRT